MSIAIKTLLCVEPSVTTLQTQLAELIAAGAQSLMVLACEDNGLTTADWNLWLRALELPVFGGVFPQIIYGDQLLSTGVLLVGLRIPIEIHCIALPANPKTDWHQQLHDCGFDSTQNPTVMVMVDGLSSNIENLLEALYSNLDSGSDSRAVGAGAGSLSFTSTPCLFSAAGIITDSAMLMLLPAVCYLGVAHGWEIFAGPFLVTQAQGNQVQSLNYKPAFGVYREAVEHNCDARFDNQAFSEISQNYPLGIINADGDLLVRDPITLDGNALVCVGEVPPNAMVYLLSGEPENLIAASAKAARTALSARPVTDNAPTAFLFDCISRRTFLKDQYPQQLAAVLGQFDHPDTLLVGALSLGEIASTGCGPIELLNKSTVIVVF
ncbi:MAG: FIST C-terminal domain-containing protein [Marinagarivorans sp.]|nr:FIST C-terminal domain-containing protein [Marinagarivorans sp.]